MKTFIQVSVLFPSSNSRVVIPHVKSLVERYTSEVLRINKITKSNTTISISDDEDVHHNIIGFWLTVATDVNGIAGIIASFAEDLSKSGVAKYYELVSQYLVSDKKDIRPQAFTYALRGLGEPLSSSGV
jgi:hypothetical protein